MVKLLVMAGADVNAPYKSSFEGLHNSLAVAISPKHLDIMKFLLEAGADADAAMLVRPILRGQVETVKVILEARKANLELVLMNLWCFQSPH